jgi:N,N'-diacetyllegionaminate synthase
MQRTLIIAEAGVNHNGNIDLAKKLVDIAFEAGADYVKFQTFKAKNIVSPKAKKAGYQQLNMKSDGNSQLKMLQKLELSEASHIELIDYCNNKGIKFLSSAFDLESIKYLDDLGIDLFKIPSGEITNYPYLLSISKKNKPVVLSTGMSTIKEIQEAISILTKFSLDKKDITVLHCNTEYPTPMEDVNLKAMLTIKEKLGVAIGYSDHTLGIEVPIAAVTMGAEIIEKHFTLDRNLKGPDHKASLEPNELKEMVNAIRNIEKAISGNGLKEASSSERKNINIARKSIHLSRDLKIGSVITEKDIIPLRPGDGICTMKWEKIIGKTVNTDIKKFTKLTWEDIL